MLVKFPRVIALSASPARNEIIQIAEGEIQKEGIIVPFTLNRLRGSLFRVQDSNEEILVFPKRVELPQDYQSILKADVGTGESLDLSKGTWLRHPLLNARAKPVNFEQEL